MPPPAPVLVVYQHQHSQRRRTSQLIGPLAALLTELTSKPQLQLEVAVILVIFLAS